MYSIVLLDKKTSFLPGDCRYREQDRHQKLHLSQLVVLINMKILKSRDVWEMFGPILGYQYNIQLSFKAAFIVL